MNNDELVTRRAQAIAEDRCFSKGRLRDEFRMKPAPGAEPVIGSALSLTADAELVCRALRNALEIRPMMAAYCFIQIKVFSIKVINTESYSAVMG